MKDLIKDINKTMKQNNSKPKNIINDNIEEEIKKIKIAMMMLENEDYIKQPKEILDLCESTFLNLEKRYGYTKKNSWQSLVFLNG